MRGISTRAGGVLVALLMMSGAQGTPATWTLQNVSANGSMEPADSYGDGANYYTVTGSFVYDADTNTFSSVNISTPFANYADDDLVLSIFQDNQHLKLVHGSESLILSFISSMTNAGGAITLRIGFNAVDCVVSECGSTEGSDAGGVYYLTGSISTDPIPLEGGDVDRDGDVDVSDLLQLEIILIEQ